MKHPIGTKVEVAKAADETMQRKFLGVKGTVVGHNSNGMTGNTAEDPLHRVHFEDKREFDSFWYEELSIVN